MDNQVKQAADRIEASCLDVVTECKKISGVRAFFKGVINVVRKVVAAVEQAKAITGGASKKAVAVEILVRLVRIPYVPTFVLRLVFSFLIDKAVAFLNKELGHVWPADLAVK